MIRYLRHKEIDPEQWDKCIRESVNSRMYARFWYLDIVSPGWDALVEEDYRAVFPVTHRRKAGFRYVCQPFFTQQLGLFSTSLLHQERLSEFLSVLSEHFLFVEIQLNSLNKPEQASVNIILRKNHELELIREYSQLCHAYPENTRRNLKKTVENGVYIGRKVEPDELISLFQSTRGEKEGKLRFEHYDQIRRIMKTGLEKHMGFILGAYSPDHLLDAAACFLRDMDRLYFLFAASSERARKNGAMFMLIDYVIRDHAGQSLILDFEGGDDPNLGRFYRGFGARELAYPLIRINRLPRIVNLIKKVTFVRIQHQ